MESRIGLCVRFAAVAAAVGLFGAATAAETVTSPDGSLALTFDNAASGMTWSLARRGKTLVAPSRLGLEFAQSNQKGKGLGELAPMKVLAVRRAKADSTWTSQLARRGTMRDRCNELTVELEETEARAARVALGATVVEKSPRRLTLVFRAYDEGVAFRYVVPEQPAFDGFELKEELTEWRFPADVQGWTTTYKADVTSQEAYFTKGRLADIAPGLRIGSPVLVETAGSTVALCEAALSNWAGLFFANRTDAKTPGATVLGARLAKLPATAASTRDVAVIAMTPAVSPWRVALVGDSELDLLKKNDLLLTLNPPPDPSIDFSWVKAGPSTWDWWVESNNSLSTELTIKLVDFAAEMGWPYHTIDGGWYGFARRPNHGPNVPLRPRKDFDLEKVVRHAAAKGVGIWVWIHWMEIEDTGVEETFARLEKWGVKGVKTDFIDRQDQWIVNWYEKVCRAAAKHHVMVNFHGAHKPTGTERTWPNNLTREGILGNEFCKFTAKITPAHSLTLPFTRFLLGPGDFTPGSFGNVYLKDFVPQGKRGHRYGDETDRQPLWAETIGTRAFALAQCIAYDSGLMTLCDWPERYRGAPGIEALRNLPASWKDTRPVAGKCGEYYAVVREAHDGRFYFAAMTVKKRLIDLKLDFLPPGDWKMAIYADDPELTPGDAKALEMGSRTVKAGQTVGFSLLSEGGAVAVFTRVGASAKTPLSAN